MLKAALKYLELGFSVIPTRQDKKPYIKWTNFQNKQASIAQVEKWWRQWPEANPAVVTGAISNISVVDCDSVAGKDALSEFLPESLEIPIAKTPHGWHFFFQYQEGISNGVRVLADTDIRNDGGYIILPPSQNGTGGKYAWEPGLKITDVALAPMPDMLFDVLKTGCAPPASFSERIKKVTSFKKKTSSSTDNNDNIFFPDNNRQHLTTFDNISFEKGGRDDALFRLANHLVKGGMPHASIQKYLTFFATNCNPPYPQKDIPVKISSAIKRVENRNRNISKEVLDWVLTTDGYFLTTDGYKELDLTTRDNKKKLVIALLRLKEKGIIEKYGEKRGCYRRLEKDCEIMDWQNANTDYLDLWLPFDLSEITGVQPGNILIFAGSKDAGKTAVLMNIAKENRHKWNVSYFSSEMGPAEFKLRAEKFDISTDQWRINVYERFDKFQDVIKPGAGNLNIIDFLEISDSFYKIGGMFSAIHKKLDGALAVIAIQKAPGAELGHGAGFSMEKARLYIAMDYQKAKIISCKNFKPSSPVGNPRGMEYAFKLVDGCKFIEGVPRGWRAPIDD